MRTAILPGMPPWQTLAIGVLLIGLLGLSTSGADTIEQQINNVQQHRR